MQYVGVRFKPHGRIYTYHNPHETPVKVGDKVEISTRDGTFNFKVDTITDEKPSFPTKAIERIVTDE